MQRKTEGQGHQSGQRGLFPESKAQAVTMLACCLVLLALYTLRRQVDGVTNECSR